MNFCNPRIVQHRSKPGCKVSVILLDWGVRESLHSLDYLNRQTANREDYELIWLEFYDRQPQALQDKVFQADGGCTGLDQWIIAGYPDDVIFNKHRLYNLGILAAQGEICVICDSDAIFTPTFIEKIIRAFEENPRTVLHLDEVRNVNRSFYPFRYPSIQEILADEHCVNWNGTLTRGLDQSPDMLHDANYGACMAARREDLLAVGGADEHLDYLGYVCGPYDLTFRLVNAGLNERWLKDEFLYHTWHPNESGINTDYHGPHDGRMMSSRSLEARASGRVEPYLENPWISWVRAGETLAFEELLPLIADRQEPDWHVGRAPTSWNRAYWIERDFEGFNLFLHQGYWIAILPDQGHYDPARPHLYHPLIREDSLAKVEHLVGYYNQLPRQWWKRIWSQPFYRLPLRLMQRARKELVRRWS